MNSLAFGSRNEEREEFGEDKQEEEVVCKKEKYGVLFSGKWDPIINDNSDFRCKELARKVMRSEHVLESVFSFNLFISKLYLYIYCICQVEE